MNLDQIQPTPVKVETTRFKTTPIQWLLLFGTAALLIVSDQLSKAWVVENFALYESKVPIPFLRDFFNFTYTRNTGAAFGMFENGSNVFLLVAVIATGVIIFYYRQVQGAAVLMRLAMGLQMGGAIGNAIDRVTRGYVVDFMHVFYDPLNFDFPIFNIADSAIVIGVGILMLVLWNEEDQPSDQIHSSDGQGQPTTSDGLTPE